MTTRTRFCACVSGAALLLAAGGLATAAAAQPASPAPGQPAPAQDPAQEDSPGGVVSEQDAASEEAAAEEAAADEAAAEEDPTEVEAVVVTGTSIRGVAAAGSETVSVNRAEIIASGLSSGGEVVRSLPQVINLGADESRRGGAQDAAANRTQTTGINLRGLGTEATLLLLNGRRLAPNGTIKALADPNIIPAAALERIEVVPDGASAIYGADAVAGVVNLITRRRFNGAETTFRYGAGDEINQEQFTQNFGRTWSGGSIFAAFEHNHRSNLPASARDFLSNDLRSRGGTDQRSTLASPGNIVVSGVRYGIPAGQNGRPLTAGQLKAGQPNLFDAGLYGDALPDQTRDTIFLSVEHDVTDRLNLWYEGFYSRRDFFSYVTPASSSLTVPRSNPFFVHPTNPAAASVAVEYRFLDAQGDASWSGFDNSQQNSFGVDFDLGHDWQIGAYGSHNINRGRARTQDLLNLLFVPISLADTNPATAFNPFTGGDAQYNNPETLRKINGLRDSYTTNIGVDAVVKADGPVFTLPGGEVRVAVGAEYHQSRLKYLIMSSLKNAANDLIRDRERLIDRDNTAYFAEAFIPLVGSGNAMPWVESLEVSLAARYENYSDFGETTNPKVGVTWEPTNYLALRATWGTSFRAPSLIDASDAVLNFFIQNFTDPVTNTQIRGFFMNGGDPNIKPEEATTWSLGFDWRPPAIKGLTVKATYYNVDYTNRIDVPPGAGVLLANEALYGFLVNRNPSPELINAMLNSPNLESVREPAANLRIIIDGRRHNLGSLKQDGVDLEANYNFSTPVGDWRVGGYVAKILNLDRSAAEGLPFLSALDTFGNPVSLRSRSWVGWRSGGWSANAFVNYTGAYRNTAILPAVDADSFTTYDGSLIYSFPQEAGPLNGVRLSLNGQNLTDEDPPIVLNGASGWDSTNASAIGRFLSVEISKRW